MTPAANAPINRGVAPAPTVVIVRLVPPTLAPLDGGTWVQYDVTLCPIAGPESACRTQRTGSPGNRRLLAGPADVATFGGCNPLTT